MPELLEIQRDFAAALRDPEVTPRVRRWLAGGDSVERRLAIYRANAAASAAKALAAAYPVVRQVVGDEFFDGLARWHLRATPSTSGDLNDYGADFADFLARFEHTQAMPYLPDVARLEWLVCRAQGARDAGPWDPAALATLPAERQGAIRFEWAAGTAVLASAFPIAQIWTIHQPGFDGEFAVDWANAEPVLVARDGLRVVVRVLSVGEAAFYGAALAGATLETALAAALAADAGFDLAALLARALAMHLIGGLAADKDPT